jgi:putative SOS response-associated peptidase YedK
MCGRYGEDRPPSEVAEHFELSEIPMTPDLGPRFNIKPGTMVPVVRQDADGRTLSTMKWGLVPSWSPEPKTSYSTINARSEGIETSRVFKAAFKSRRCLVPASVYYEWPPTTAKPKPAYKFVLPDEGQFAFPGLWEEWQRGDAPPLRTVSIVTGKPNELVRHFHHRMPVILEPNAYDLWLDPKAPLDLLHQVLRPYEGELLCYPVGTYVNDAKHEGPECAEPIGPAVTRPLPT